MYAVIPTSFPIDISKYYSDSKRAEVGSYDSSDKIPLNKEEVRTLLLSEGLV